MSCNVGVTRAGVCQSNLRSEMVGQHGHGQWKQATIWEHIVP